jgi:hypothetical protein
MLQNLIIVMRRIVLLIPVASVDFEVNAIGTLLSRERYQSICIQFHPVLLCSDE